jgi:hypothetical protein
MPFYIFQENCDQQLVVASLGSEVSTFGMPPSIPDYKKNFSSTKHPYQYL